MYWCNPLSLTAVHGEDVLWHRPVRVWGQPKTIQVVGQTLFVTTSSGQSFYSRKSNGEIIYYANEILAGKDAVAEIIDAARRAIAKAPTRLDLRLSAHLEALVELEDRRALPLLIECIEVASDERGMVIAGLEKFNGQPENWDKHRPGPGSNLQGIKLGTTVRDEQARWRKILNLN